MFARIFSTFAMFPVGIVIAELTMQHRPPNPVTVGAWIGVGIIIALVAIAHGVREEPHG